MARAANGNVPGTPGTKYALGKLRRNDRPFAEQAAHQCHHAFITASHQCHHQPPHFEAPPVRQSPVALVSLRLESYLGGQPSIPRTFTFVACACPDSRRPAST